MAEGVEIEALASYLKDQGVEFGQGWLFAKALPLPELQRQFGCMQRSLSSIELSRFPTDVTVLPCF